MTPRSVERVVLRAAVGHDNYADVEKLAALLDSLEARGAISPEGLSVIIAAIADEIVTQRVAVEFGSFSSFDSFLSCDPSERDTPVPEDPHE